MIQNLSYKFIVFLKLVEHGHYSATAPEEIRVRWIETLFCFCGRLYQTSYCWKKLDFTIPGWPLKSKTSMSAHIDEGDPESFSQQQDLTAKAALSLITGNCLIQFVFWGTDLLFTWKEMLIIWLSSCTILYHSFLISFEEIFLSWFPFTASPSLSTQPLACESLT